MKTNNSHSYNKLSNQAWHIGTGTQHRIFLLCLRFVPPPPLFPTAETSDQWGGNILVWFEVKHLGHLDFFFCVKSKQIKLKMHQIYKLKVI